MIDTDKKRLRMFAGPNGSGKSTVKISIEEKMSGLITLYINPDEIEQEIKEQGSLDLEKYQISTSETRVVDFFTNSTFLKQVGLSNYAHDLRVIDGNLIFNKVEINSYFASVAADFIRHVLLENGKSFAFETVMSSPDKIDFLQKAQNCGYRTYLYYVATEDPEINVLRVQSRVSEGGHSVPKDKIISRYHRSLDLLIEAVKSTNRAYIFDNSFMEHLLIAEITDGKKIEMKTTEMPAWFKKSLWDKANDTKRASKS